MSGYFGTKLVKPGCTVILVLVSLATGFLTPVFLTQFLTPAFLTPVFLTPVFLTQSV